MKKLLLLSIFSLLASHSIWATKFLFQTSPDLLPPCTASTKLASLEEMDLTKSEFIIIKVATKNKETGWGRIFACTEQPMAIDVREGDEIAELSIERKCKEKKVYCTKTDEIYIAYPKPPSLESRPSNPEQEEYKEKLRRYNQQELVGKTKFLIKEGWGINGFFDVKALD